MSDELNRETALALETGEGEQRKRIDALYWGGVLLWGGLVFGAESLGILPEIGSATAWSWVFFGAGLYGLLGSIYRTSKPGLLDANTGDYIWSIILLVIGLGGVLQVDVAFPVILVAIGVVTLAKTLLRRE